MRVYYVFTNANQYETLTPLDKGDLYSLTSDGTPMHGHWRPPVAHRGLASWLDPSHPKGSHPRDSVPEVGRPGGSPLAVVTPAG